MDSDGYPTEEEIERIKTWPFEDVDNALEFVASIWHWPDFAKRANGVLYLATGGWSGNEEIIGAMQCNIGIWYRWICSSRGGAHEFELTNGYHDRETRFKLEQQLQSQSAALADVQKERDEAVAECQDAKAAYLRSVSLLHDEKERLEQQLTDAQNRLQRHETAEQIRLDAATRVIEEQQAMIAQMEKDALLANAAYRQSAVLADQHIATLQATIQRLTEELVIARNLAGWATDQMDAHKQRLATVEGALKYYAQTAIGARAIKALAPSSGNQPKRDNCQVCNGAKGGVPGNENIVDGVVMCDYCHGAQPGGEG